MTPEDAARALIQRYVERGDSYESFVASYQTHFGDDYGASIGVGYRDCRAKSPHELVVFEIACRPCCHRFSLRKLYDQIKAGVRQQAMLM